MFRCWISILPLISLGLMSSCEEPPNTALESEWWRLETQRVSLAADVELKRFQLEHQTKAEDLLQKTETQLARLIETRSKLSDQLRHHEDSRALLEEAIADHQQRGLQRRRLEWAGTKLPSLTATSSRRFDQVTVVEVSEAGVSIRHSEGLARLTFDDLSEQQCREFGIDPETSRKMVEAEQEQQQRYRRWADAQIEVSRREPVAANRPAVASTRTFSDVATYTRPNPLHEKPRAFGSGRIYRRSYRPRYYTIWVNQPSPCRTHHSSQRLVIPSPPACPSRNENPVWSLR